VALDDDTNLACRRDDVLKHLGDGVSHGNRQRLRFHHAGEQQAAVENALLMRRQGVELLDC
jgi:hypothetical protein